MEGYIQCLIQGNLLASTYYFILHEETLIYCDKKDGQKLGQLHLKICKIDRKANSQLNINSGTKTLQLKGSPKELDIWESVLKQPQNQEEQIGGLTDEVAKVKSLYFQFEETLRLLTQRVEGNSAVSQIADDLETQGNKLKSLINNWLSLMDGMESDQESEFQSCLESAPQLLLPQSARLTDIYSNLKTQPLKCRYLSKNLAFMDYIYSSAVKRQELPSRRETNIKVNIWADLKPQIYQKYLKIPIYSREPLSFLQRLCEGMQYTQLLEQANSIKDSGLRLSLVIGFVVAQFSHIWDRNYVPFKPLRYETFEYDGAFTFIAEQVTTEISAFKCQSDKFDVEGEISWEWQFSGANLIVEPNIKLQIQLPKHKDDIQVTFKDFKIWIMNLIFQRGIVLLSGEITLTNPLYQEVLTLNFQKSKQNKIQGRIVKENSNTRYDLNGQWHKSLSAFHYLTKDELVVFRKVPEIDGYKITDFGIQLNHLHQWNITTLPITDSRFRGDSRALENMNFDLAMKMNEKMVESSIDIPPRWFTPQDYKYNSEYFKVKKIGFNDQFTIF